MIGQVGVPATALDWGREKVIRPGVSVAVTRNHHWGSRWFADRTGLMVSSFVVKLPGGNIFFAGDTGMGDGRWPEEAAKLGPVRLALLPIGGVPLRARADGLGQPCRAAASGADFRATRGGDRHPHPLGHVPPVL